MADLFPIAEARGPKTANVIFFHGLGGDAHGTWSADPKDKASLWPAWLAQDIEGVSVYSVGYEASVSGWNGSAMELTDRAANVLNLLLVNPDLGAGELILVGHSLGGLVIKQVLRKAADEAADGAEASSFIARVRKVAFLATPHVGSDLAGLGDRLRVLIEPSAATRSLLRNDQHLRDLNLWYRRWARQHGIDHLILTETKTTSLFGMIVKPDSSDPGLSSDPVPIDTDHIDIAKPLNRESEVYQLVLNFIKRHTERPVSHEEIRIDGLKGPLEKPIDGLFGSTASFWSFLKAEENQKLLGWIGGGLVVLATGFWAVFTFYVDHSKPPPPPTTTVEQKGTGIASGRDTNINAPVTINPDAMEVVAPINERLDKLAAQVARDKGVEIAPLLAVLGKLGEKGVKDEDIPKRLDTAADELIKLRAEVEQFQHGPPALAVIAQEAQSLIDKGDLDGARRALVHGREAARAQRSDASRDEAKFLALDARLDDLQLAYRSAAAKYAEAAGLVASFDTEQQWRFLLEQAGELYKQGNEFGDNAALVEAIDLYRRDMVLAPRSERPLDWAMTQNELGNALRVLGERESGTARLEEAVAVLREALEENTRARVPLEWAKTQNSLGGALFRLGERESGTARLKEAAAAYREALQERTRARVPLLWAATQDNLGGVLFRLGERESGTARLEEAVAAFREALQERTRERVPLDWAGTQDNLSAALATLGERESGTARLGEAVAAYRDALQVETRARVPLLWAGAQLSLGTALFSLGEREGGTARLEEAVAAYREALQEDTRARVPRDWAVTQMNLGIALQTLGGRESGTARLEEAVSAYREALQETTRERAPLQWAATQMNLGNALETLGGRESGTARLEEAVSAYRDALQENTRARVPLEWAKTQFNLGLALETLGWRESGTARLEEAVSAYREALQERTRARVPLDWAATQMNLGNALQTLGGRESGTARLEEAIAAYREALQERTRARVPLNWATGTGNQGLALMLFAERRGDAKMAKLAVQQIEAAFATSRDGGDAPSAAYYEARLPKARALAQKLAKR